MQLNKTNLKKYLKYLAEDDGYWGSRAPCRSGVLQLNRLLRKNATQKRSLKTVFENMQELEKETGGFNIGWLYEQMTDKMVDDSSDVSFNEFKKAFEKLDIEGDI